MLGGYWICTKQRVLHIKNCQKHIGIFKGAPCPLIIKSMFCHFLIFDRNEKEKTVHCIALWPNYAANLTTRIFRRYLFYCVSLVLLQVCNFKQNCSCISDYLLLLKTLYSFSWLLPLIIQKKRKDIVILTKCIQNRHIN